MNEPHIRLVPWSEGDLDLLWQTNSPEMTDHLGGPESDEKIRDRHQRYLKLETGRMFRVEALPEGLTAGSIGYWERPWRGGTVFETGWGVLPAFQGRGIAVAAARAVIEQARADGRHRWLHAFPGVDHPASNAVCRKAGFTLLGDVDFEYPPGTVMRSNDWRVDLHPERAASAHG
ncbi:MAG: GNAT family N-acetyltransferase [Hamadaea sp.]|nr:GNAT family N-acetyltransferase [Hamadaea sp.]